MVSMLDVLLEETVSMLTLKHKNKKFISLLSLTELMEILSMNNHSLIVLLPTISELLLDLTNMPFMSMTYITPLGLILQTLIPVVLLVFTL